MKLFLKKLCFFFIPIVILLVSLEIYVRFFPSTFSIKANYIKKNADIVQVLILGSSHHQNGFDPDYFSLKTANLAYGGQSLLIDSALFFHYIDKMKKLKYLILEMSYLDMEKTMGNDYYRLAWYYIEHNVEIMTLKKINKMSLYSSNPTFFNNTIIANLSPFSTNTEINEYGYDDQADKGLFVEYKYDSLKIELTAEKRLGRDKNKKFIPNNFNNNKLKINSMVDYCSKHNIQVLLISPPMYKTYTQNENSQRNEIRKKYIDSLIKISGVSYFDFESDKRFYLRDFKNDDHMNPKGGEKFSKIVDSIIKEKEGILSRKLN